MVFWVSACMQLEKFPPPISIIGFIKYSALISVLFSNTGIFYSQINASEGIENLTFEGTEIFNSSSVDMIIEMKK